MRLLDSESLEAAMQNSGVDLDLDARDFYTDIWNLIKASERLAHDTDVLDAERNLRDLCHRYFEKSGTWLAEEDKRNLHRPACPEARILAMEAQGIHKEFEKKFYRYLLCYLYLNRALVISRAKMKAVAEDSEELVRAEGKQTSDSTGFLLKRALKEKRKILEKRHRLIKAQNILEEIKTHFEFLESNLMHVLGRLKADRHLTVFTASLRQGDFRQAETATGFWRSRQHPRVQESGQKVIKLLQENQQELAVHGGYVLDPSELRLIFSLSMAEEQRVDQFIDKYALPHMAHKLKSLLTLGYRLGKIGSIEGLLGLHAKLISGIARPSEDVSHAKRYEEDVLGKVQFLLQSGFNDLPKIFDEMEVTFDFLRFLADEIRFLENHVARQA